MVGGQTNRAALTIQTVAAIIAMARAMARVMVLEMEREMVAIILGLRHLQCSWQIQV